MKKSLFPGGFMYGNAVNVPQLNVVDGGNGDGFTFHARVVSYFSIKTLEYIKCVFYMWHVVGCELCEDVCESQVLLTETRQK